LHIYSAIELQEQLHNQSLYPLLQPNPPQLMSSGAMSVQSDPSSIAQSLASSDDDTLENRTLIKRLYNLVDCVVTSPNLNNFIDDIIND